MAKKRPRQQQKPRDKKDDASNAVGSASASSGPGVAGKSALVYVAAGVLIAISVAVLEYFYGPVLLPISSAAPPQPPLERNVGIIETIEAIRANHQTLKVFDRPLKSYTLLETLPHNSSHFTQGLYFHDGHLYEGTGLHGKSVLAKVEPRTGKALETIGIQKKYFGEGCARTKTRIVQLTYKHRRGFLYDASAPVFTRAGSFTYETRTGQGWGIAYDAANNELVVSDGSSYLFFWDADTLAEKRYVRVKIGPKSSSQPLEFINELEVLADGRILANVWYADVLVAIDPASGEVTDVYNFETLHTSRSRYEDCFNGIALDATTGHLYVTGKQWPKAYLVSLND